MVSRLCFSIVILLACAAAPFQAISAVTFKFASLAPEGSTWISHFREFAREVEALSEGEITITVYPGGVMGDDRAMYRKLRVGQLHGGGFTVTGITPVIPDFGILAVPFLFQNYQEVDQVIEKLFPIFREQFQSSGLELLAMTEVGFIYNMSTSPTNTIDDLRQRKIAIPAGDKITSTFFHNLGISPIPLTIPDVMSSLQTGLVDTVFTSLYGTIVMQWFTKAIHISDMPYGYGYGAIAFSTKQFGKLSVKNQEMMRQSARKHFSALNNETRKINHQSREVLHNQGVTFHNASAEDAGVFYQARDKTIRDLIAAGYSAEIFSSVTETLSLNSGNGNGTKSSE